MIKHFKESIKEHITWMLALAVMLIASGVVIASNELIAKMLPDAAELAPSSFAPPPDAANPATSSS